MKFVFIEKDETETNILLDILSSEGINFTTKLVYINYNEKFYDITINVNPEKYFYIEYLLRDKLQPYRMVEKIFEMDEYNKNEKSTTSTDIEEQCKKILTKTINEYPDLPIGIKSVEVKVVPITQKAIKKHKKIKNMLLEWLIKGRK